ncbi:ATP-dependent helicase HrpA [hydrothermal vent metagenome]|uniref:ATP-dependent helicase HrpA n=1 Tax=hydrothermal vent metagenome TaxID=652676 RepID=A0A3B0VP00_9ZZZZ
MLEKLLKQLPNSVLRQDFFRLRQQLFSAKRYPDKLAKVVTRIEHANQRFNHRLNNKPKITLATDLPVSRCADEIIDTIKNNQIVVIAGETGSGKTTQLPKMCLLAGLGNTGLIACTQPRRIAARSMAQRVSEELNTELGKQVGYQVRFDDKYSADGWIKFMTDGVLLAETQNDKFLNGYDCIIIDEAHERSLNIDFLLGYLKQLAKKRPDLKIIITSATIDTAKFADHFDNAPVINVEGRSYPVDIIYQPLDEDNAEVNLGIYAAIQEIYASARTGDILVFLSGEREILEAQDYLSRKNIRGTEILPLYARLTAAQQMRVFHPGSQRRIILTTNVAETSLTVPRIHYVIDSGVARISRYSSRSKIQGLLVEPISQASANQRSGRCGRIADGVAYRLYSQDDFNARSEHTDPEIVRTSLASVILRSAALGFGSIADFPFVDPPNASMIADGYQLLSELHAIDDKRQLTVSGKKLNKLPIDVQLGQILIKAEYLGCIKEALIIVSALTIQDVRERPLEHAGAADATHKKWQDVKSDFLSFVNIWNDLSQQRNKTNNSQFRKWCHKNFISYRRYIEWQDIYKQLLNLIKAQKVRINSKPADYASIHQAILAGFISHIGYKKEHSEYQGARNRNFHIFPGSGLFTKKNAWIMAASIVQTTKVYARTVAAIEPEWIEDIGKHVIKTSAFDPYWSKKQGSVMGYQRLSLFGLPIVAKRPFHYGPTDIETAHKLFIENGLVQQQLRTKLPFYSHNQRLIAQIQAQEDRQRKQDILLEPWRLAELYSSIIPAHIYSEKQLTKWLYQQDKTCLKFTHEQLTKTGSSKPQEQLFPKQLSIRDLKLDLHYNFSPGEADDGITVVIPLQWLNSFTDDDFQWLVPGLIREKLEFMLRTLPKPIRRNLVPASEYALAIADSVKPKNGAFYTQIIAAVARMSGSKTTAEMWQIKELPTHLRFIFKVIDKHNKVHATSRDFSKIKQQFHQRANKSFQQTASQAHQVNKAKDWVFQTIDKSITLDNGLIAYPAIVDQTDCVGLRLFETQEQADDNHLQGLKTLVKLKIPTKYRYLLKNLNISIKSQVAWNELAASQSLKEHIADAVLQDIINQNSPILSIQTFDEVCTLLDKNWLPTANDICQAINPIIEHWYSIWQKIEDNADKLTTATYDDMQYQLDYLIYADFLYEVEIEQIKHYPRFIKGLDMRLSAAIENPQKEAEKLAQLQLISLPFYQTVEAAQAYSKHLQVFHILLEEYRISLFAQNLGTKQKVSDVRMAKAWEKLSVAYKVD